MRVVRLVMLSCVLALPAIAQTNDPAFPCVSMAWSGFRPLATQRTDRFLGKVRPDTALCRGGENAAAGRPLPWTDWQNYWATGDLGSTHPGIFARIPHLGANGRGVDGALLDLEYQRIELIRFNLLDNNGTYQGYLQPDGDTVSSWVSMQLPDGKPCRVSLMRYRTLDGTCNDLKNPRMGSSGMLFARNVEFDTTFPDLGKNEFAVNRQGGRIDLMTPDPQLISRELFVREDPDDPNDVDNGCNTMQFYGLSYPNETVPASTNCAYQKASFFNVLAAFWIQFMTHDWFSHLENGQNNLADMMKMGCSKERDANGNYVAISPERAKQLGCRPDDVIDAGLIAEKSDPSTFQVNNRNYLSRAYRTMRNTNTAWWDASMLYGFDEQSRKRVRRDGAKLAMVPGHGNSAGERQGYLPAFTDEDVASNLILKQWAGQEATAFPDNWSIGMSFFHNVFAREHNLFVDEFRAQAAKSPDADSGLRDPEHPTDVIRYRDVDDDLLFEVARLVVAAEIAKIHTIEWTPQLLYDEPLYLAMNANWNGLFADNQALKRIASKIALDQKDKSPHWFSVFASGAGIFGLGSKKAGWNVANVDDVNGGVNHFGSPFNFPEEFVTVYRLHPLVPDLIEYRDYTKPDAVNAKVPLAATIRGKATESMHNRGLANWALSMGRQRLGLLTLGNHPHFLQDLPMPRLGDGKQIDVLALDLIRDRERGVPRFNEFRRQYGLRQLNTFDDFMNKSLASKTDDESKREYKREQEFVAKLRRIYGQHACDESKIITTSQLGENGKPINDCHGFPNGTMVDNIEDVDTVVGWLAESARPHGFAISETQFQVFILNASRRLFSDRFFTSSFRPEFYSTLGVNWVMHNGPGPVQNEAKKSNGHKVEVSPLKRLLMRTIPELQPELAHVVNAFDPWARNRNEYYDLTWQARPGVTDDPAFKKQGARTAAKQ